jgi:hypothetical protein
MTMDYTLRFEQRDGYLYAHVRGEHDSVAISTAYWSEIARRCHELDARRLLVVEELAERADVLDVYEVASGLVALGFSRIRIAFVDLLLEEQPMMQFAERVARNRGIDGRVFRDEAAAEAWLLSSGR